MTEATTKAPAGATDVIEEAVHLIRRNPVTLLLPYYAGTLPFIAGFLYFCGDMSQSAFAADYLAPASLGLALLFVWMKCFQSLFARRLLARLTCTEAGVHTRFGMRDVAGQAFIQGTSFAILPLSALVTLPFGWVYAYYQTCLPAGFPKGKSIKASVSETFRIAARNPMQNHIIMALLFLFKLFVMLNMAMFVYTLPQLAKSLLGIETAVATGGFNPLNSTYLLTVLCLTHLCVDPLVKTVYTLRYFYGLSEESGEDLLAGLKALTPVVMLGLVTCAVIFGAPGPVRADDMTPVPKTALKPERLEQSIDHVLKQRDFAWRMPREEVVEEQEPGMIASFFRWMGDHLESWIDSLEDWIDTIGEWLKKLFPDKDGELTVSESPPLPRSVRYLIYALMAGMVVLVGVLVIRNLRAVKTADTLDQETPGKTMDLTDEQILADELPSDSWRDLADELLDQGDFRLALRALYLSTLARLSETGLVTVAAYKSNREYREEVARRAHEKKELIDLFSASVTVFEGVWYGMHDLGRDDVLSFADNQERIGAHAH